VSTGCKERRNFNISLLNSPAFSLQRSLAGVGDGEGDLKVFLTRCRSGRRSFVLPVEMEVFVSESEGREVMIEVQIKKPGNLSVFCVRGKIVRGETELLRSAVLAQDDASLTWRA